MVRKEGIQPSKKMILKKREDGIVSQAAIVIYNEGSEWGQIGQIVLSDPPNCVFAF